MFVFVWVGNLETVREELGRLYPFVRYLIPFVFIVVTAARALGIARSAWRLVENRLPAARLRGQRPSAAGEN